MNVISPASAAARTASFDVERIRADFPILSETVHGKPLTYLDNGASAQKPLQVIDAISQAYSAEYANVHRGLHYLSNLATENFEKARGKVRAFLNAAHDEEIIFTRNATEAVNLVASSFGAPRIEAGDVDGDITILREIFRDVRASMIERQAEAEERVRKFFRPVVWINVILDGDVIAEIVVILSITSTEHKLQQL